MPNPFSEDHLVEAATMDALAALGWETATAWHNETFGPDGLLGREDKGQVVLERYLNEALRRYNPGLPGAAYARATEEIARRNTLADMGRGNKEKYGLLRDGVPVTYTDSEGKLIEDHKLRVFDFNDPLNNHFLAVRQLEVISEHYSRRPDVIGFVNGLPLVFFELKEPGKDIAHAYHDNLSDYKDTIPHLFDHNAFVILSNGTDIKLGTITSPLEYFSEWKRNAEEAAPDPSLSTTLLGTCGRARLMDIFENFLLFDDSGGAVKKLLARNHQYLGVNRVFEAIRTGNYKGGKLGVFWHTQGSGKSYSMVFLGEKVHRKLPGSYTFLLVLDRTELENQIYDTFSGVGAVREETLRAGKAKGITGREHLRQLLAENHRYVFSLIHKFSIDDKVETSYPLLTERRNVIVISDEAHRSQNGTFADNMRFRALPNAAFLGFTGTPIIEEERELTRRLFGDYISIYDFGRAVADHATLPLRYLNRGEKLEIDNPELDEQMAAELERADLDEAQRQKLNRLFARDYPVLTAEPRLRAIARDVAWHFNERGYQGKAMFVALDKPTAVRMYDYLMEYWPQYITELESQLAKSNGEARLALEEKIARARETEICVVVSSEQNEVKKFWDLGLQIEGHRASMVRRDLEKEFKDPRNPFRLAIVCAMWITGFDAPSVSTVYLDKPLRGHTLMQTIARANRVYDDEKINGLIVDYGNVYRALRDAYATYGNADQEGAAAGAGQDGKEQGVGDLAELEAELVLALDQTEAFLTDLGFDPQRLLSEKPLDRLAALAAAADAARRNETTRAGFEALARNVSRKYLALYPEPQAKRHSARAQAIRAVYKNLNQQVRSADVTSIIAKLQGIVGDSMVVNDDGDRTYEVGVSLTDIDLAKLRNAFVRTDSKNTLVFDLQTAVQRKLNSLLRNNPLRTDFLDHYRNIIAAYNAGKDQTALEDTFNQLTELIRSMSEEEQRFRRAGLADDESLAIFDLLLEGREVSDEEKQEVATVAENLLQALKASPLRIARWVDSREAKARVRTLIQDQLLYLPQRPYPDPVVSEKTGVVYQHVFSRYGMGANMSA